MGKRTTDETGKTKIENKRGNGEGTEPKWNEERKVWQCQVTLGKNANGKLHRPIITGKTRTECRENRDAALASYRGGSYIKAKKDTFNDYLQQWLDAKKVKLQPTTWISYDYLAKTHLKPEFGETPLQQLSRKTIQETISQKSQKLRPSSVSKLHMIINNVCALAVHDKVITENPCQKIELPKVTEAKINVLSEEEMTELMTACWGIHKKPMRLYHIVFLDLRVGMRRGEILGLSWDNINFATNEITVEKQWIMVNGKPAWSTNPDGTKTAAGNRTIPAPEDAMTELQRIRDEHPNDIYVFQAQNGLPRRPDHIRRDFKQKCRDIGLDDTRFHDLRHNYGTALAAAGIHQRIIESMLGHTDYRSSRRYIHATKKTQQEAASVIGEAMKNVKNSGSKPVAKSPQKQRKKPRGENPRSRDFTLVGHAGFEPATS